MEYVALYRKYRPKVLDEIYGQDAIVKIVKNSILNNKFMHAYLFSGPRGTGKTTIAKLIAKIVNCSDLNNYDPCNKCSSCKLINDKSNPDIIEIDAASNNGVDEIRTIRDSVVLMPSVSKYKVYIIDEVHMLSTSAFNALLKTLEEPPKHVIFILATTEINKVPDTIVSRCQCYDFKRIGSSDIVSCLSNICKKEKIDCEEDVLLLIANYCNGGMRDSIGLLDKLLSYSDVINKKLFYDVVGLVDDDIIADFFVNICNYDVNKSFDLIEKLVNHGKSVELIIEQLLEYLRKISVSGKEIPTSFDKFIIILNGVSDIFNNLKNTFNQLLFVEVEVLKIINMISDDNTNFVKNEENNISREIISHSVSDEKKDNALKNTDNNRDEKSKQTFDLVQKNLDIIVNNAFALANKKLKEDIVNKWNGFYDYVHNREFSSFVSYFLDSSLEVVGEKDVIMSSDYSSIVDGANRNLTKLELLFNLVMGKSYNIAFVSTEEWKKLKDKYVSDIKNGKKYKYIEDNGKKILKNDIINETANDLADVTKDAKSVFGEDIIEIK